MAAEIIHQIEHVPTHIYLQAGVGGLAGAMAAWEKECLDAIKVLPKYNLDTSSSGGAGIAAMTMSDLPSDARVLCILSEGPDE